MPKLPLPPCSAQNSSLFSSSLAVTTRPSAATSSTSSRLSQASPHSRSSQPEPPPSVRPATPVDETRPPVVASPCGCVARSKSLQVAPPPTVAVFASGSTSTLFMRRMSMTSPPSTVLAPATLWPPERIATSRPLACAWASAAWTSATDSHWAMSAGRRSIMALKIERASS